MSTCVTTVDSCLPVRSPMRSDHHYGRFFSARIRFILKYTIDPLAIEKFRVNCLLIKRPATTGHTLSACCSIYFISSVYYLVSSITIVIIYFIIWSICILDLISYSRTPRGIYCSITNAVGPLLR